MTGAGLDPAGGDRRWMEQALALAATAEGSTSPNPRVGCVIVRDGEVVGRGFHQAPGLAHAEAMALDEAGDLARGATLYVNLEPCAHQGRTPPCVRAIVGSGVARIVAAVQDPNPLVDGKGFLQLREAGIAVEVGLLEGEARRLNEPFFHVHATGRPLVTLKAAASLDGMIAAAGGASRWITGRSARRFAHRLRASNDAILVGAGTVRRDDPRLTIRLDGTERSTLRVVLSRGLDVDPAARVFRARPGDSGKARIYTTASRRGSGGTAFAGRAEIVAVGERGAGLDLREVLADLARRGAQSVLVEGGGRTFSSFLEAGLADRAALFISRRLIGSRGGTALLEGDSVAAPAAGWRLVEAKQLALDRDLLLMGRIEAPGAESPEERCSPG